MLITFSGVDNAGKSTQITRLSHALREDGRRVKVFWYRPGYSQELDLLRAQVRRFLPSALPTNREPDRRQRAFARPETQTAWILVSIVDMLLQLGGKVRAFLAGGHIVLCDRYLMDAMLDLELRFPTWSQHLIAFEPVLRWMLPVPSLQFLFTLPLEDVERRAAIKKEPFPDEPEMLKARWERYRQVADSRSNIAHVIDGKRPIDEVHREILEHVRVSRGRC